MHASWPTPKYIPIGATVVVKSYEKRSFDRPAQVYHDTATVIGLRISTLANWAREDYEVQYKNGGIQMRRRDDLIYDGELM